MWGENAGIALWVNAWLVLVVWSLLILLIVSLFRQPAATVTASGGVAAGHRPLGRSGSKPFRRPDNPRGEPGAAATRTTAAAR